MGTSRGRRLCLGTALGAVLLCGTVSLGAAGLPAAADPPAFHPGAASLGDPLAPGLGNGGYDVGNYDIRLTWAPDTGLLTGRTTITATLKQNLSRFNLGSRCRSRR
jgi:hypothetical protein